MNKIHLLLIILAMSISVFAQNNEEQDLFLRKKLLYIMSLQLYQMHTGPKLTCN